MIAEDAIKKSIDRFPLHLSHPEVSLVTYRTANLVALSAYALSRKRIYLDTKLWVGFRDHHLGRATSPSIDKAFALLRKLSAADAIICPVSYSCVYELLNQDDASTRTATAAVMDELSRGICIVMPHYLLGIELECSLRASRLSSATHWNSSQLVWTKVGFWLGDCTFSSTAFPPDVELAIQKSMDDVLAELTVSEMSSSQPPHRRESRERYEAAAEQLTTLRRDWPHSPSSFEAIYTTEIRGLLEAHSESLCDVFESVVRDNGHSDKMRNGNNHDHSIAIQRFVFDAHRDKSLAIRMPQLHILACLYAVARLDNNRPYRATDFEDFRHAASALPYCDVFISEKHLTHLLRSNRLKLDTQYSTIVVSDLDEAISVFESW